MADRASPYSAFNFLVEFNEGDIGGGFAEVTGLGVEITVAEYRNGDDKQNHVRKVPNINKVSDVTLKRGIISSEDIWEWIDSTRVNGWPEQRTVTIRMQDEASNEVAAWTLSGAIPIKYTGPSLNAKGGSDVAMEELVLSAEYIAYSEK